MVKDETYDRFSKSLNLLRKPQTEREYKLYLRQYKEWRKVKAYKDLMPATNQEIDIVKTVQKFKDYISYLREQTSYSQSTRMGTYNAVKWYYKENYAGIKDDMWNSLRDYVGEPEASTNEGYDADQIYNIWLYGAYGTKQKTIVKTY